MSIFLSQARVTTRTERVRKRVRYLEQAAGLRGRVVAALRAYLAENPQGTEASLAALAAIGQDAVQRLAEERGAGEGTVKQDIGAWVVLLLLELYPPERVETLRQLSDKGWVAANGLRPRRGPFAALDWVTSFTQHRLADPDEPSPWRQAAVARANRENPLGEDGLPSRYPVYAVWRRLLLALPELLPEAAAQACAQALFQQAQWRDRDLQQALAEKLAALREAPFPEEVVVEVEQLWRSHLARERLPGLGRFRGFSEGLGVLLGSAAPTLRALRALALLDDEAQVPARVVALVAERALPLGRSPRLSECLHLCRPGLPFISEEQVEVVAELLACAAPQLLRDPRQGYARHLPDLLAAQARLGLSSGDALDSFLTQLRALHDPRHPEAYAQETERLQRQILPPRALLADGASQAALGAHQDPEADGDDPAHLGYEAQQPEEFMAMAAEPATPYGVTRVQSPFRTNPRLVPVLFAEDPALPLQAADWPEGELWPGGARDQEGR